MRAVDELSGIVPGVVLGLHRLRVHAQLGQLGDDDGRGRLLLLVLVRLAGHALLLVVAAAVVIVVAIAAVGGLIGQMELDNDGNFGTEVLQSDMFTAPLLLARAFAAHRLA